MTARLSKNEENINTRSEANISELKILKERNFLAVNELFITESFETVASELFESQNLVDKIVKANANITLATQNLQNVLEVSDKEPANLILSERVLEVFKVITKIRNLNSLYSWLSFERYLKICSTTI